jgi:uncharacterized protein
MSERDNRAMVQKLYEAFNRGDLETVLASVAPNAEWVDHGPAAVPYYGDFSGRIGEFFQAIGASVAGGSVAIDEYIASGDTVVTRGRWVATARSTGAGIDADMIHFWTLRGGKVTNWHGYGDTAAVLVAHTGKAASA